MSITLGKRMRSLLEGRCNGRVDVLTESIKPLIKKRKFRLGNVDLGKFFREFVLGPGHRDNSDLAERVFAAEVQRRKQGRDLSEADAGFGVRASGFLDITGQLVFSEFNLGFTQESPVLLPMVSVTPSLLLETEIAPEFTPLSVDDVELDILEGDRIPEAEVGEAFRTWPAKTKRGLIVSLTKEVLFSMRSVQLQARMREEAGSGGKAMARSMERELLDLITGGNNNYNRNGAAENTYSTTGDINDATGTALADWTDVEAAERVFDDLTHPDTGEPLEGLDSEAPRDLLVSPFYFYTARRIARLTEVRVDQNPAAGTVSQQELSESPLPPLRVISSRRFKNRLVNGPTAYTSANADKTWIYGNLAAAFGWLENWPVTMEQAGPGEVRGFENDIVQRWKATGRGAAYVREKRAVCRRRP